MDNKKQCHILIVDDSSENIEILFALLQHEYILTPAKNGESAIRKAHKVKPDLILLDIIMPGMDGYAVCKSLKSDAVTKDIPVIFVTAISEAMDEAKAFELGAVDYITKPFVPAAVKARVSIHLSLRQYQNHLEDLVAERTRELQTSKAAAEKAQIIAEEAKRIAEKANKAKSNFLMNMSHELRTPLNGIITATNLALDYNLEQELKELVEIIKDSSENLEEIIGRILDFSRLQDNDLKLQPHSFRLDEILSSGLKTHFTHKGEKRELQLIFEFGSRDLPNALIGDAKRLLHALNLILENAAKFNTGHPIVIISIKCLEVSHEEAQLQLSFKDNGIGIAASDLEKIFEPFSQVDTSITRQYDGVGMGLSICKTIIEMMDGRIWAESNPGEGSTFYLTLPVKRQAQNVPFDYYLLNDSR